MPWIIKNNWLGVPQFIYESDVSNNPTTTSNYQAEDHTLSGNIRATSSNIMIAVVAIAAIYAISKFKK